MVKRGTTRRKKGASLVEAALVLPCLFLAAAGFLSFGLEQYTCAKEQVAEHRAELVKKPWKGAGTALTIDLIAEEGKEVLPQ